MTMRTDITYGELPGFGMRLLVCCHFERFEIIYEYEKISTRHTVENAVNGEVILGCPKLTYSRHLGDKYLGESKSEHAHRRQSH